MKNDTSSATESRQTSMRDNLMRLRARLSDHLSPAEMRDLQEAAVRCQEWEQGPSRSGKSPHRLAAFINAIAEEGTKAEAITALQETWNDYWQATEAARAWHRAAAPYATPEALKEALVKVASEDSGCKSISAVSETVTLDREWWKAQGIDACLDRMALINQRAEEAEHKAAHRLEMFNQREQLLRDLQTAAMSAPSATRQTSVSDELWDEIYAFIDDHVDVRDGQDGPLPNRAMSLKAWIDRELP